jgi:hypothetical protein
VRGLVEFAGGCVDMRHIRGRRQEQRQHREECNEMTWERTTHAVECSGCFSAPRADRLDFDRGCFQPKAKRTRAFVQGPIEHRVLDLGDPAAPAAHQELSRVRIFGSIASHKCIERVQAMDETGFLQELQCPVDRGRGGFLPILAQFRENFVGANRLVLAPHDLENAPAQRSEVDRLRCAHPFSSRDRTLDASRMIMRRSLPL